MTVKYSAGGGKKFFYEAVSSGKSKPDSTYKGNR